MRSTEERPYSGDALQHDNLTDALSARGLATVNKSLCLHAIRGTRRNGIPHGDVPCAVEIERRLG